MMSVEEKLSLLQDKVFEMNLKPNMSAFTVVNNQSYCFHFSGVYKDDCWVSFAYSFTSLSDNCGDILDTIIETVKFFKT